GNRFQVIVRDVSREERAIFSAAFEEVRAFGVPNYFDDQRFGSVTAGSRESEVGSQKSEVGSQKSEIGGRQSGITDLPTSDFRPPTDRKSVEEGKSGKHGPDEQSEG